MWKYIYEAHGDWLALAYSAQEAKQRLERQFQVSGIPSLVVIDPLGRQAVRDARGEVMASAQNSTQVLTTYLRWKAAAGATGVPAAPAAVAPGELPAGLRVRIRGLTGAAEHNGVEGVIKGYSREKGRYVVDLDDGDRSLSLRAANLLQLLPLRVRAADEGHACNGGDAGGEGAGAGGAWTEGVIEDFDDEAGEIVFTAGGNGERRRGAPARSALAVGRAPRGADGLQPVRCLPDLARKKLSARTVASSDHCFLPPLERQRARLALRGPSGPPPAGAHCRRPRAGRRAPARHAAVALAGARAAVEIGRGPVRARAAVEGPVAAGGSAQTQRSAQSVPGQAGTPRGCALEHGARTRGGCPAAEGTLRPLDQRRLTVGYSVAAPPFFFLEIAAVLWEIPSSAEPRSSASGPASAAGCLRARAGSSVAGLRGGGAARVSRRGGCWPGSRFVGRASLGSARGGRGSPKRGSPKRAQVVRSSSSPKRPAKRGSPKRVTAARSSSSPKRPAPRRSREREAKREAPADRAARLRAELAAERRDKDRGRKDADRDRDAEKRREREKKERVKEKSREREKSQEKSPPPPPRDEKEELAKRERQKALEDMLVEEEVARRCDAELQRRFEQTIASEAFKQMVREKVEQRKEQLEKVMLEEAEEKKREIEEADRARKEAQAAEERRLEEDRKKEQDKLREIEMKGAEERAAKEAARLQELERKQQEERARQRLREEEEKKKREEKAKMLNVGGGQRKSVGFSMKKSVL
ncbi:unnamed protein product [Prorocentrum cordatum]|uniref:Uncharacterized protein n=1 Tax=Prorocentrum cordatum TaxID=2364126 RepID=A0ABN9U0B0_9DINO|nr:unnamed protein product [Polarella glacialis]